jgi:hypothetical protein
MGTKKSAKENRKLKPLATDIQARNAAAEAKPYKWPGQGRALPVRRRG